MVEERFMKWCMLGLGLLVLVPGSAEPQGKKVRGNWHSDYVAAKALAKKTGKPLMVVFRCEP
jgi:hypothetical protein